MNEHLVRLVMTLLAAVVVFTVGAAAGLALTDRPQPQAVVIALPNGQKLNCITGSGITCDWTGFTTVAKP